MSHFPAGDFCRTRFVVEKCSLFWLIENFSFNKQSLFFESPIFSSETTEGKTKWLLRVYPPGINAENKLSIYLVLVNAPSRRMFAKYKLTFRSSSKKLYEQPLRKGFVSDSEPLLVYEVKEKPSYLKSLQDDKLIVISEVFTTTGTVAVKEIISINADSAPVSLGKKWEEVHHMLLDKVFTDVTIKVGGVDIAAHQVVLAACSPVLKAMLQNDTLESNSKTIEITDFDFKTINEVVHFIYSRKNPDFQSLDLQTILNILEAADKYAVHDLMVAIVSYFISNLNSANVIDVLLVADLHSMTTLKERAIDFICVNKDMFSVNENYKYLEQKPHLLMEILQKMCRK